MYKFFFFFEWINLREDHWQKMQITTKKKLNVPWINIGLCTVEYSFVLHMEKYYRDEILIRTVLCKNRTQVESYCPWLDLYVRHNFSFIYVLLVYVYVCRHSWCVVIIFAEENAQTRNFSLNHPPPHTYPYIFLSDTFSM